MFSRHKDTVYLHSIYTQYKPDVYIKLFVCSINLLLLTYCWFKRDYFRFVSGPIQDHPKKTVVEFTRDDNQVKKTAVASTREWSAVDSWKLTWTWNITPMFADRCVYRPTRYLRIIGTRQTADISVKFHWK